MPIQTGIWVIGFSFFLFPAGHRFIFMAAIMAILGLTGALGNIALDNHVMRNADQAMLARVTSVGRLVSFAACSIGPITGGILAQRFGNQHAMSYLFLLTLIPLVLSIFIFMIFKPRASIIESGLPAGPEPVLEVANPHASRPRDTADEGQEAESVLIKLSHWSERIPASPHPAASAGQAGAGIG